MVTRAILHDGTTVLEFPDGTPDDVIHKAVQHHVAYTASKASVEGLDPVRRDVGGAVQALNKAIPGADEVAAGANAVADVVTGRTSGGGDVMARLKSLPKAWSQQRALQDAYTDDFAARHPVLSNLTTGAGLALQAVPAFLTGGASAVPTLEAALANRGVLAGAQRLGVNAAKAGLAGAAAGYANAAADTGSLKHRLEMGRQGAVVGGITGAGIPLAGAAARQVSSVAAPITKAITRAANKAAGGTLLDPATEVAERLGQSLSKDGATPEQAQAIVAEWRRVGGPEPTLLDVVSKLPSGGQATIGLIRGAAMKAGPARGVAVRHGEQVVADLQDDAIARTRQMTPDQRSVPAINADVEGRIAGNSTVPDIQAGQGGARVSGALNSRFDSAKSGVDQAYAAARAADPERAHIPKAELPVMAQALRESVADFHPHDVPRVARALSEFDDMGTLTVRDAFDLRSRLSNLRASADPVEGKAAGKVVRALDAHIEDLAENGRIGGDPEVVDLWRNAIAKRREMGRQFEGDDLIEKLTKRGQHGDGRTNLVAPEDATNAMIGKSGVLPRQDAARDLARVRDTLGVGSPEWSAFQEEARNRLLNRDAGTERFGTAWRNFERQNPELAGLLMPEAERAGLAASQGQIGQAVADRNAVAAGQGVLSTVPDQYAAGIEGAAERMPLAQVGAARDLEDAIGRPAANATGVLNRIGTATSTGRNLGQAFGPDQAADYRAAINNLITRVNNARAINPNTGSQTATRLQDEALVELPSLPKSPFGVVMAILRKIQAGATLTDAERELLLRAATSQADGDIPTLRQVLPQIGNQGLSRLAPTSAALLRPKNSPLDEPGE